MINLGDQISVLNLFPIADVTASGNSTGVDLMNYSGEIGIILDCSAPVAGSSPTLDVKIQESADNSSFSDVTSGEFSQVTSSASVQKLSLNKDQLKRYIRVVRTIGGTSSPQYLVSVKGVALLRNPA